MKPQLVLVLLVPTAAHAFQLIPQCVQRYFGFDQNYPRPTWRECKAESASLFHARPAPRYPVALDFDFSDYPIPRGQQAYITPRLKRLDIVRNATERERWRLQYGTRLEITIRPRILKWILLPAHRMAWNFTAEIARAYPSMRWPLSMTQIEAALLDATHLEPAAFYVALAEYVAGLSAGAQNAEGEQNPIASVLSNMQLPLPITKFPTLAANVTVEIITPDEDTGGRDALLMCRQAFIRFQ